MSAFGESGLRARMVASVRAIFDLDQRLLSLKPRLFIPSSVEDFVVAEITKLSVGKALDKLRGADAPKSRMTQLDGKIGALDEEIQRIRATRRRLERNQRTSSTDPQEVNARRVTKLVLLGIIIGIVIVIPILVWKWGLL